MLRSKALALAIVAAAALPMAGCDRPTASPPASVDILSEAGAGAVKLAQQSVDESNEKSSAPDQPGDLMEEPADTGDKSADTGVNMPADTSANVVADDAAISAKVSSALAADVSLGSADIKVEAKDGSVTLSGNVDTPSLRLHAREVAARQRGVVNVIDKMTIASHG